MMRMKWGVAGGEGQPEYARVTQGLSRTHPHAHHAHAHGDRTRGEHSGWLMPGAEGERADKVRHSAIYL